MKTFKPGKVIRILHWLTAANILILFSTAEDDLPLLMDVHIFAGKFLLVLILTRLLWALIGPAEAGMGQFFFSVSKTKEFIISMMSMKPIHYAGHNPVAGWLLFTLYIVMVICSFSGLAALDLPHDHFLEEFHEAMAGGILLLLFAHLSGIALHYFFHKENRIKSMLFRD